jgi:hypothetical protein
MQTLIVIVIVAAAIYFAGRRLCNLVSRRKPSDCHCGCENCSEAGNCKKD